MTQASDDWHPATLLISDRLSYKTFFQERLSGVTRQVNESVVAVQVTCEDLDHLSREATPEHFVFLKCLDRFWLAMPQSDSELRTMVVEGLFDLIATGYEQLADTDRNKANIKYLMDLVNQNCHLRRGDMLLDFGCGTGISTLVLPTDEIRLLGVERCKKMRALARLRGLVVISPEQMSEKAPESCGAAIASYVMHFCPAETDLLGLWRLLRAGGILAANFHKGFGTHYVDKCLKQAGANILIPALCPLDESYGEYRVYVKD